MADTRLRGENTDATPGRRGWPSRIVQSRLDRVLLNGVSEPLASGLVDWIRKEINKRHQGHE